MTSIEFLGRECRNGAHNNCHGLWEGFGFKVKCVCKCGHLKRDQALETEIPAPSPNATAPKEVALGD